VHFVRLPPTNSCLVPEQKRASSPQCTRAFATKNLKPCPRRKSRPSLPVHSCVATNRFPALPAVHRVGSSPTDTLPCPQQTVDDDADGACLPTSAAHTACTHFPLRSPALLGEAAVDGHKPTASRDSFHRIPLQHRGLAKSSSQTTRRASGRPTLEGRRQTSPAKTRDCDTHHTRPRK